MTTTIYTDGSALGQSPNYIGGWAAIIRSETIGHSTLSGSQYPTTNNAMELEALLVSLKWCMEQHKEYPNEKFIIYTDSQYALSSITEWMFKWALNNWRGSNKKEVKNLDIMKEFYDLLRFPLDYVSFGKVKGHSGDEFNEMADRLAVHESTQLRDKLIREGTIK